MFKFILNDLQEKCMKLNIENKASLWHIRLGHLHYGGLRDLTRKYMVHGLPDMDYTEIFCECCVLGQTCKELFSKKRQNIKLEGVLN